ncbi:hypothetical protein EYF80_029010 [Liparis tanakae]|uniref:Uncharacterized protein n=1 Tax=Liparis tanakae TaxID=230148 RepID=A0A4Z2H4Y2_9TELE|nr:hypothetical protein EYF80_029010 [Liparis tanakae]
MMKFDPRHGKYMAAPATKTDGRTARETPGSVHAPTAGSAKFESHFRQIFTDETVSGMKRLQGAEPPAVCWMGYISGWSLWFRERCRDHV